LQAIERLENNDYWFTIIIVILIIAVFFLKVLDVNKLKGYTFSIFSNHFVTEETAENTSLLNPFQSILFLFSVFVLSLLFYNLIVKLDIQTSNGFYTYFLIFTGVFSYLVLKWLLEYLFSILFLINKQIRFFLVSKSSYLYSISFFLLIGIILTEYSQLNTSFLIYLSATLFLIRFLLHLVNNKKLILSKLFYFILYLCAFEIAPLCILFKLMF
jgi:hypothetical protein